MTVDHHLLAAESRRWARLGNAMVWDLAYPSEPVFRVVIPEFAAASLSPEGDRLYAAAPGRQPLRAYDVESGRLVRRTASSRVAQTGGVGDTSPDGSTLAVASGARLHRLVGHRGAVNNASFGSDDGIVYTTGGEGLLLAWEVRGPSTLLTPGDAHDA